MTCWKWPIIAMSLVLMDAWPGAMAHETLPVGLTDQQRYDQTISTVVRMTMTSGGMGSGIIVASGEDGTFILTNFHVIVNETWLKAEIDGVVYDVTLVKKDEKNDLALMHADVQVADIAHMHDTMELHVYDEIIAVGGGQGEVPYPSIGIVSVVETALDKQIQLNVHVAYGMSGGAIWRGVRNHYELVGMMKAVGIQPVVHGYQRIMHPVDNVGFAIPMAKIREFLDD